MSAGIHYQTVAASEEQHLASLSTTINTSTSSKSSKVKTTKKVSSKKLASTTSIEIMDGKAISNSSSSSSSSTGKKVKDLQQHQQQYQQLNQQQQQLKEAHCSEESTISQATSKITVNNGSVEKQKSKVIKKKSISSTSIDLEQEQGTRSQEVSTIEKKATTKTATATTMVEDKKILSVETTPATNGKKKSKKNKKSEAEKENISVKSSFSKFDALQKKNLIHVRSSDAGKAQEIFSEPQTEKERNCRLCLKPVYKMEEIKAEKCIYHKNCFRCHECSKQLKVDNYQSHEGILYCMVHFKLLFAPKFVEDSLTEKPRKPELIIRENQPAELPPDVVRASDKPNLGLEELQQLNVRSKFQVFENGSLQQHQSIEHSLSNSGVKRSASILSKMAKLEARGFTTGISENHAEMNDDDDESLDSSASESDDEESGSDGDQDLVRSKKRTQRERPVGLGHAMNDIKTKFEEGHIMSKEERREERKQEIQSIRSRLFLGKQARIKEMYQQAVADSEQAIVSVGKKTEIEVGDKARLLKERFEKGELFKDASDKEESRSAGVQQDEADVFESAISKKSRSIFMELDANAAAGKNQPLPSPSTPKNQIDIQRTRSWVNKPPNEGHPDNASTVQQLQENVVRHDETPEDVKVETSEISSKFKFFETYRPAECQKKEFRITPPREGVVKLPTPDTESEFEKDARNGTSDADPDAEIVRKSHTASLMLNKFREMEQRTNNADSGPKPLKCFTPPPDGGRRVYQEHESETGSEEYDDDEDGEEEDEDCEEHEEYRRSQAHLEDEALKEAQAAARAKKLRAKFEKWEANEIQREIEEGHFNKYSEHATDEANIESTKSIRERFENMKNLEKEAYARPRYQVNRFV